MGSSNVTPSQRGRLLLIVDMGTTFATVARIVVPPNRNVNDITYRHVEYFHDWPRKNKDGKHSDVVPTKQCYGGSLDDNTILWGWSMSSKIENPWDDIHQLKHRWITGLKLLLDSSIDTSELEKKLDDLQRDGFIHAQDDAFTDYLVQSLTRVREKKFDEGFVHPEFVICAPIAWSVKSYHRWYSSFGSAIRIVWPEHDAQTPPRITTASEPEAAASYCLSNWGGDFEVC